MNRRVATVALLLFGSGLSALTYQAVWLRQFRLIFGASTAASAAVLAIFLGGLGLGGVLFGKRADAAKRPLLLYGQLELGVAASAALTPLLLWIVRAAYLATGGSAVLGTIGSTVIRLLLSTLVLAIPTLLMGGTLPAAARAVEEAGDRGRNALAAIYAINTFGGVAGTLLATFFLLERAGNRMTLFLAALLNAFVALAALAVATAPEKRDRAARTAIVPERTPELDSDRGEVSAPVRPSLIFAAAAISGFVFLLMELVWYRMLAPLLGGTAFTFGLTLAFALIGIALGSLAYALFRRRRASIGAFAICSALEAAAIALPFALGDRIALLALFTRPLGYTGFAGFVVSWSIVTAITVLPAAFASGVQFPMLISLLGEGREDVGRHVGLAYAWNTAGSIAGSLAGGFGLLPLLTAPGAWRLSVVLLGATALAALVLSLGRERRMAAATLAGATLLVSTLMLFGTGPTGFWRHTPIGAGRADQGTAHTPNRVKDFVASRRRQTVWQAEGVESSVSVDDHNGYSFIVNGKGDGHGRLDAGTQLMSGMLAALLHPNPKRAAVIGLGTGTTAGWLAALPSMEHVDVVEIEPAIQHVAAMCAPVNHDALSNPKLSVRLGDGREFLLAGNQRYDVIAAEPSNPYRAGIASLFTTEFYRACRSRLNRGGMLLQFLQAYEIDAGTLQTVYASITATFPHVETWQTQAGDLLLVASESAPVYDRATIQARMRNEVPARAAWNAWWALDADSVLAHYVCGNSTARLLASGAPQNTDDRTRIEYAFARTLGNGEIFSVGMLREFARRHGDAFPLTVQGEEAMVIENRRMSLGVPHSAPADSDELLLAPTRLRGITQSNYVAGNYEQVWTLWQSLGNDTQTPLETLSLAEALAQRGDEAAVPLIEHLHAFAPIEADALLGRLRFRQKRLPEAAAAIASALRAYRDNPWPLPIVMERTFSLVNEMVSQRGSESVYPLLREALSRPFAIHMFEEVRISSALLLETRASVWRCGAAELELIRSYEPNVPWQRAYLERRAHCYEQRLPAEAERAARDLRAFNEAEPPRLVVP